MRASRDQPRQPQPARPRWLAAAPDL